MADGGPRVRVVLADSEASARAGLRAVLAADPGISVVAEAADGEELLVAVRDLAPDVVLLDLRMPRLDGLAALRRMPGAPPYCAVLTTFALDDHVQDALDAGAYGFLLKDVGPDFLLRAVHDLAAGGAVLDPRIVARLLPRLRSAEPAVLTELTDREREVLVLLGEGSSNAEIGDRLRIAESTVKGHVTSLLHKLGAENRVQAALVAMRLRGRGQP